MESEVLCTPTGDSLIVPDKMHAPQQQEKEDANVAQTIQEECDKKFGDSSVISNGNGADVEQDDATESDGIVANGSSEAEEPAGEAGRENGPQLQNGNRCEEEKCDIGEPDSLNAVPAVETPDVEAEQAPQRPQVRGVTEKRAEVAAEAPETLEMAESRGSLPESQQEISEEVDYAQNQSDEAKLSNGANADAVEMQTEDVCENGDNVAEEKAEPPSPEPPVQGHYQPEKCESFVGISVRDMVNDMPRVIEDEMKAAKESVPNGPRKSAVATSMDTESVRDAYNDIRADNSATTWAVFKYETSRIICSAKGVAFDEFKKQFDNDERAYGYIRLQTGDEMSKRHKFLFVTWIGPGVSVLKRAKMSIDKAIIKNVVSNFAVELQLETQSEFDLPFFIDSLNKASGANYGTGVRDI